MLIEREVGDGERGRKPARERERAAETGKCNGRRGTKRCRVIAIIIRITTTATAINKWNTTELREECV